jgi:hypothetical protein
MYLICDKQLGEALVSTTEGACYYIKHHCLASRLKLTFKYPVVNVLIVTFASFIFKIVPLKHPVLTTDYKYAASWAFTSNIATCTKSNFLYLYEVGYNVIIFLPQGGGEESLITLLSCTMNVVSHIHSKNCKHCFLCVSMMKQSVLMENVLSLF